MIFLTIVFVLWTAWKLARKRVTGGCKSGLEWLSWLVCLLPPFNKEITS